MLTEKNGHAHAWPFSLAMRCRIVLNVIFLTEKFYRRYEDCPEIEQKTSRPYILNCTPFVRQYDILSNKWGVLLCQKEYQTNDIRRSSREWL